MSLFTSIKNDVKRDMASGNMLTKIIIVNIAVFLLVNITAFCLHFGITDSAQFDNTVDGFLSYLALPFNLKLLLYRPWTILTHMFLHYSFWHILWNMLILFWFGRIWTEFTGQRKLLPLYIYGAFVGAVLAVAVYYTFPHLYGVQHNNDMMLGASAGIMAVMLATAALMPDYTIFIILIGPVKIKYIALVFVVLDMIAITYTADTGGHFAHLGGGAFGYFYTVQLRAGNDWSKGFNKVADWLVNIFSSRRKPHIVYSRMTEPELNERSAKSNMDKKAKQAKTDAILDKIARSGYESLSKQEKEFLFKMSKEDE